MKKYSFLVLIALVAFATGTAFAQGGGKAEPNVIKFAKGKSSAIVTNKISGDEQAEYSFTAKKGQRVTVANAQPAKFSFVIFNDELDYNSGDVSKANYSFIVPESGEYMFVVKRVSEQPGSGRFSLTLGIR